MRRIPNVFVIVSFLLLMAACATWILPSGAYDRTTQEVNGSERTVLVDGSYHAIDAKPQFLEVFTAPLQGFLRLSEIIAFIFLVGGAFAMVNDTGAITAGIHRLVHRLRGREFLIIPIVMTLFSFFGALSSSDSRGASSSSLRRAASWIPSSSTSRARSVECPRSRLRTFNTDYRWSSTSSFPRVAPKPRSPCR